MMLVPRNNFDLFDDIFKDSFFRGRDSRIMQTDIREDKGEYIIDVDLPGYEKEDIKIDVTNGYLTVKAMTNLEKNDDNNRNYVRRERFFGECSRSFYVGEEVEGNDIKAMFRNGILTVRIPKKEKPEGIDEKKYIEIDD